MGRAKEIEVRVIPSKIGNAFVKRHHYSRKVVPNSQLHFGAFLDGKLHGVMSYRPPSDKSKVIGLVDGTIYRASNFVLTGIKKNSTLRIDADGNISIKL